MDNKFFKKYMLNSEKSFLKYLVFILSVPSLIICLISLFTIIIDPYAIFDTKKIEGINKWKIKSANYTRTSKLTKLFLMKPDKIIIGSSTAETGFVPQNPFWGDGKLGYNFGLSGGSLLEAKEILKLAKSYGAKDVILITDFIGFLNPSEESNLNLDSYRKDIFSEFGNSKLLLNWLNIIVGPEVIRDSFFTLFLPNINPEHIKNDFLESDGSRSGNYYTSKLIPLYGGNQKNFQRLISIRLKQWKKVCDPEINTMPKSKLYSINSFEEILRES